MSIGQWRDVPKVQLDQEDVRLYRLAVSNPGWTRAEAMSTLQMAEDSIGGHIANLRRMTLLRDSLDPSREFDAVSPDLALAALLVEDENEIRLWQAQLARVRQEVQALLPTYYEARQERRAAEAIDVIDDVDMVRHLLADQSRRARVELHIAHPGSGMSDDGLARSLALDMLLLERGVTMRTVLQHSTRNHQATQRYAATVVPRGALLRTVPVVPRRLIVFDREVAFLPPASGDPNEGAVMVREPGVVQHLISSFDALFDAGLPFPVDSTDDNEEMSSEIYQAILQQMSAGEKDEGIARRLGMSVRTCRRHIAAILASLGAQSRFQAGVLAHQRGLLGGAPPEPAG
ncbi:hypothetical protein GCM10010435_25270 [Winogradskya consettensis]|uniref:HTH luxR-type domain-containing protein n=1 Tax=Winogradskya consettensis TaxID=113560 RepID=A0A919VLH1_9ACTN|nr:helix-turn-helix transcriptional regulator [Actinoplanes consettensis]GIM67836.1 hypothetical protein Aco04nite_08060 [Actinoplanes consettensis]